MPADPIAAALRENQQLMDALNQHSIVSVTDRHGTITSCNALFSQISGYSRDELIGQNHRVVKSDHQPDVYWEAMWKTISSGANWRATVCNKAKSGALYWVDTLIAPFFDADGNIEKYVSIRTDVTAARNVQAALAYEREHLRGIIEGTNAGTWEWEVPTGKFIINARSAEIIGYPPRDLGTLTFDAWTQLCHPEDLARANNLLEEHFGGLRDAYECEIRMRHHDGHWVWVQSRGKVSSRNGGGEPHWVSGIHVDVSAQRLLQSELRENNRVMQSILDHIPVALSVFDSELKLVAKNDLFAELLGFPAELFAQPRPPFERFIRFNAERGDYGPDNIEQSIATIVERARHTTPHQFERVRVSGLALEVRGAPMPGGGFITTYADITARKHSEAELARTTGLLQSVLDSASGVSVITVDMNNTITLFNTGAQRMLGYRADEVVARTTPEMFHDHAEMAARCADLSAQLGRTVNGFGIFTEESTLGEKSEWTYIRKNGERITVALVITPLTNAQGQRTGYLGVAHDITQEKANEQGLRAAKEEAEHAALAKGQFLANMSHEIRTPMNAILGMLKLLHNTELDARQLDYTTKTESAARSLLGLLNDILDYSKAEAGKMELDPHPFRLDRLMRELSVILSANIGGKGIELLFDIDPALPPAFVGDSMRLQQVLINLSGNAIKFTERGEVVVSFRLVAVTPDGASVRIAVKDSGIGIAPENQQRIFSGFSQAEASTTRRFGGTGLGLAISRRLVELMGGELLLASEPGKGSLFYFTITMPVGAQASDASQPTVGAMTALVVDDNPIARDIITAMGKSLQWEIDVADSGAQALQRIAERAQRGVEPYQTIFMDWQMPDMDGWETTQRIRQLTQGAHSPIVIMVTAHGREQLEQRSVREQSSLNGFLVKPITAAMLHDAVLDARASMRQQREQPKPLKTTQPRRLAGMRLLLVEDNPINQQVAQELLRAEGASVDLADNGQLGVDAVAQAQPQYDAVLMDLQMPVMDGYDATRAIRSKPGMQTLPIIAMTANAMASDREACLAAGMNDHIGKPFELSQLVDLLHRHTGHGHKGASPTTPPALPESPPPPGTTDIPGALARLGGNTDLYLQIVEAFLAEIACFPELLAGQLERAELVEATRSLHTIKGLALTVGASHLSTVCQDAEHKVKAAVTLGHLEHPQMAVALCAGVRDAIASTTRALQRAPAELGAAGPSPVPAVPATRPGRDKLLADLQQLRNLLINSDMHSLETHTALRQEHGLAAVPDADALRTAIDAFDFAQGVVQCDHLIRQFSACA